MAAAAGSEIQIGGEYWWAQLDVLDALESGDYDLVVFRTGYGGGKTLLLADWILSVAVQTPASDNLILAPDRTKGGPTTYKKFFQRLPGEDGVPGKEVVPDEGGDPENSPLVAEYNAVDKRLTLHNRAIIRLGSADKWNRYAGGEFNAIACDEPAHYDNTNLYKLHEMLVSRQRTEAGPNVTLWSSTGAGFNDYYDITERQVNEDGDPLPWADTMKVIEASALENPWLEEKAKLKRQFQGTAAEEQALHGGFAAPEGLVYKRFNRNTHVVPEAEVGDLLSEHDPIYGYDAGWDNPRVFLELRRTHRDQWIATRCYYESEREFEDLCDPEEGTGWAYRNTERGSYAFCEHEPEHIQKLKRAGFKAKKANKDLDEGIPYVRKQLKVEEGRPGLLVSDACDELIREFLDYREEDVGKSGASDHALDALRYALYTQDTGKDPGGVVVEF